MQFFFNFIGITSLLLLTSCYNHINQNNAESETTKPHTLLIQALPESIFLTTIVEAITEPINNIIKEEIGLDKNNDFNFFIPKPMLRLTLYYINDIAENNNDLIISSLNDIMLHALNFVSIAPSVEFFEGPFNEKDELVIMIHDQKGELIQLHNQIKTALHKTNMIYRQQYQRNLYDQEKSEKYDYIPHIGLGRIRATSINNHLADPSQFTTVFSSIQKKIKIFIESLIKDFIAQNNDILFVNKIGIFDLDKKTYIKEYFL